LCAKSVPNLRNNRSSLRLSTYGPSAIFCSMNLNIRAFDTA
jgi:hypothetical protein